MKAIRSDRGMELFVSYGIADRPILTVENYIKWYDMYVVFTDLHVEKLQTPEREKKISECENSFISEIKESAYGDHVFNPRFFAMLAAVFEFDIDPIAFEVVIGRWFTEHNNITYEKEWE